MTNKTKPTSKVIQISGRMGEVVVLCEDGSVWQLVYKKWECILEAQTNDK